MNTKVRKELINHGRYKVYVYSGRKKGSFETTDMQLVDDIEEVVSDGWKCNLIMHESFEGVIETCERLANFN
ncbi:MAG: hypothetical protein JKY67_14040 [Pseudomonadales bacterium]|nr:hypothetical protein [Pseudomonadales bacterium]